MEVSVWVSVCECARTRSCLHMSVCARVYLCARAHVSSVAGIEPLNDTIILISYPLGLTGNRPTRHSSIQTSLELTFTQIETGWKDVSHVSLVGVTPFSYVVTAPTGPVQPALAAELTKRARLSETVQHSQAIPACVVFRCRDESSKQTE